MLAMRSMLQCHPPHQGELDDSCHVLSHALTSVRRSSSVRRAGQRPQPRRRRRIDGHGGVAFGVLLRRSDQARYTRRLRQIVGDQPIVGRHRDPVGGLGWPPRPGLPDDSRESGHSSLCAARSATSIATSRASTILPVADATRALPTIGAIATSTPRTCSASIPTSLAASREIGAADCWERPGSTSTDARHAS